MARRRKRRPEPDLPLGNLRHELAKPEFRKTIADAQVILGVDVRDPKHITPFFGRVVLERIIRSGSTRELIVTEIPLDFETDDIEALGAACLVLKGSCCYRSRDDEPGKPDMINPDPHFN